MFDGLLTVRYLTSKNCFCTLSVNNFKHLQNNVLELHYNDNATAHVSVAPSSAPFDDQSIGINSLFAKTLGVDENSLVAVREIVQAPTIQSVTVTTLDDDDYSVLESLAENVQSTLLEQIRVLNEGQKFIVWIGKTIHVTVSVCSIKPISPGKIDNLTEVVIKPPEKEFKPIQNEPVEDKQTQNTCTKKVPFDFLAEYMNKTETLILRVVPFKDLAQKIGKLCFPFNVFVSRSVIPQIEGDTTTNLNIFMLKLLSSESEKSVHVRLIIFEDFLQDFKLNKICSENIFVSDVLQEYLSCDIGCRVMLEPYQGPTPDVKDLEIYTKKNCSIDIVQTFQQYLADSCREQEFVLNSDVVIDVTNKLRCFIRCQPCKFRFCVVNPDFVRNCKLVVVNEILPEREVLEQNEFTMSKYTTAVANYQDIIDKCLFLFAYNTKVFSKMYNVLITGKSGTGKTTLLKTITNIINSFPYFIFTKKINCKAIKGKTVESLHKLFSTTFFDLIHHQPSVLILDDIHILCENVNEGDGLAQQAVYFNRVSEMLEGLFNQFCEHNAVGILATTESTSKLNKHIYATRGNHLFKNVYNIDQLQRNDRLKLFDFFFTNNELENVDLRKYVEKTESFVMQDMVDLANKTLFESYQEDPDQTVLKITADHIETALKTVTETTLAGVNLHPPGEKTLDDIGGLADAKKILLETMLWPAKYPDLFTKAPLRLPSGLLLYGPPGTGKTLLAGAAAKHCGLRLISIKGPELLSKYIGASEQAVRDVFQRAQSAKPCILFFDEFDSLAPRRGHDNTGVTDRVVNQLLTQLDGIESLSGVFVLAATSRPDLLDPALLRPGRLDIHIRCSLPDEISRLEILEALSKPLKFSDDANLVLLAQATEGFSGADLQAVLYSAQLESVKGLLEDEANTQEFQTEIHQVQLMEALKNTRPSLTRAERMKYEQIYRNFEGGGSKDFTPGSRATLA
ncbi:hypothetical protein Zmor_013803 [Zophobas morio]|uniref:Peroxisomal ATPase PEX1 n=1 Tax=Zophobas morio TaxID=2755281 RepID=A0AA38IB48_9CUCU|nr:hypothetical protein Zmor_013803 [Zophobas morio]